jgi:WW domain-containing oxidoreductase
MMAARPFGKHSTADDVLAGLDLTGQTILLTGCATGIGLETLRALAAHGAHVIAVARSEARAAEACAKAPGKTTPIACDQDDFASVAACATQLRAMGLTFDAIIANAGIMGPPHPDVRYGVESQFRVNHLAHMLLITRIADRLREGSGRLVMVSSSAAQGRAPKAGVDFDNLDGARGYKPFTFYGQSKLANLTFAKSMAKRLAPRGVTSNAIHPGVIATTALTRSLPWWVRLAIPIATLFDKSIAEGAATQCYAATRPDLAGVTGGFYADCRPYTPNPHADDPAFQDRLWAVSEAILAEHAPAG